MGQILLAIAIGYTIIGIIFSYSTIKMIETDEDRTDEQAQLSTLMKTKPVTSTISFIILTVFGWVYFVIKKDE